MAEDYSSDDDLEQPPEEKLPPPIPTGVELTAFDSYFRNSPYPTLADLRERDPVHHDMELNRYFLTRHADVATVLDDEDLWCDPNKARPDSISRSHAGFDLAQAPLLPLMDGPAHARLRGLVSAALSAEILEAFRPRINTIVTKLLDELDESEFEIELMHRYAARIPRLVIAELFGIDPQQRQQFTQWSDAFIAGCVNPNCSENEALAAAAARTDLDALFSREIAARRGVPTGDLISAMLRAEHAGASLHDVEIIAQCRFLLAAGNITATDLIGNGIRAMLQNTRQMTILRERPELIGNAVEEVLRFDSPVVMVNRIANRDIVVGGCPIARGETVSVSLAGANRDESVYELPDHFDIERADTHHHSFGGGRHVCLGARLARMQAEEAILGMVVRFPEIELSPLGWEFAAFPGLRSLKHFWVRT